MADFEKHNVIFVTPVPNLPENTIIHVDQKGYMLGERVLRAAKIGVVKNS
jgi:molecular chaperone GrpE